MVILSVIIAIRKDESSQGQDGSEQELLRYFTSLYLGPLDHALLLDGNVI